MTAVNSAHQHSHAGPSCELLFVYGTLRKQSDHPMAKFLADAATFIGTAYASGSLYKIRTYCGFIYEKQAESLVKGDLYSVPADKKLWKRLDYYEAYDRSQPHESLFIRRIHRVRDETGQDHPAWIYLYNRPPDMRSLIPSGDFLKPRAQSIRNINFVSIDDQATRP